jgi:hypothetical protein
VKLPTTAIIALSFVVAACGNDREPKRPLVFGKAAEPVGPLATVKFGMSDLELTKAAPQFDMKCGMECEATAVIGDRDYTVTLTAVDRQVTEMRVYVSDQKLETLTAAWGPGVQGEDSKLYWANADRTIRASVTENDRKDGFHLTFERLTTIDRLVDKSTWSLTGIPMLGTSGEAVRQAALAKGYELGSGEDFEMPPTMHGAYSTRVSYKVVGGAVVMYEVALAAKTPAARDAVLAELAASLGEPTIEKDVMDKDILVYAKDPRVTVRDLGIGNLYLAVEQPGVVIPE